MNALAEHAPAVIRVLADSALRALVLALVAGTTLRVFRVRQASTRLAVWTAVLYASLALPLLTLLVPPVGLRLPASRLASAMGPIEREWVRFSKPAVTDAQREIANQQVPPASLDRARQEHYRLVASPSSRVSPPVTSVRAVSAGTSFEVLAVSSSEPQRPSGSRRALLAMLRPALTDMLAIGLYLFGLIIFLTRLGVGMALGHRLRRRSSRIDDPRALRWFKWHALAMGIEKLPRLAESKAVAVPLTLGTFQPVILVPPGWRTWETGKLAAVLAHELAHVRRNDSLVRTLSLVYRSVFWFSPLSWWLERRLADLAEQASDAAALHAGAEPSYYAEVLMNFFNIANAERRVNWQGVSMARGCRARKRIEGVLLWNRRIQGRVGTPVLVLLGICALPVVVLTAAMRPSVIQADAISVPAPPPVPRLTHPPAPPVPSAPPVPETPPPAPAAPTPAVTNVGAEAGPAPMAPEPPPAPASPTPSAAPAPPPPPAGVRLSVYPGATRAPENDGARGTVRLRNSTVRDLSAVRYVSSDPPEKVLRYYRDELEAYGPVIQCAGGSSDAVYVDLDDEALTNPTDCKASEIGVGETELKVVEGETERIVAVKAHGAGSEFALVTVCPGSSTAVVVPAVLASVAPLASVTPAVQVAIAASARHVARVEAQDDDDSEVNVQNDDDEDWTINNTHNGMEYAIVSGNHITMNGSSDDRDEVRSLQKKIPGDFIWFIHNGDSYVIRDAGTVKTAKQLYAPMEELGRKQEALGKQQEDLGQQQEALGKRQEEVRVKVPADLEARLKKVEDKLHRLAGTNASQEELADLQGELGDLQGELGDLQGRAGGQQGELGRRQGELGEKQGELGRRQGELGREQGHLARQAARQMQDILHRALSNGQAQRTPE